MLLIAFTGISFANIDTNTVFSSTSILAVDSTEQLTMLKVYEDVKAGISGLATALKAPAEHVYMILIKQQYVKAWVGVMTVLLTLIFIGLSIKFAYNIEDWEGGTAFEGKSASSIGFFIAFTVLSILFILITTVGGYPAEIIQGFVNPEYGAIKDIIEFVK